MQERSVWRAARHAAVMCVDESDGCGRVSPAPVCLCARNERKGAKRMVGEVDGGVRKKV